MYNSKETRTTTEINSEAVKVNQQVTTGLKNALKLVDDTREIQTSTLEELANQREQLCEVQNDLNDVAEEAKHGQNVLNDVGRRFWFFNFIKTPKHKKSRSRTGLTPAPTSPTKTDKIKKKTKTGKFYRQHKAVSTNTVDDRVATVIEEGRKEQDDLIERISAGLDTLKLGAESITTELESQDQILNQTQNQTETALDQTKQTANHATFNKYLRRRYYPSQNYVNRENDTMMRQAYTRFLQSLCYQLQTAIVFHVTMKFQQLARPHLPRLSHYFS